MQHPDRSEQHAASLARIAEGGAAREQGTAELYREFRRPLLAHFRRAGLDTMQCEDLLQDVFVRVVRAAGDFRRDSQPSTWIWQIARNRMIDHLRVHKPEQLLDDEGWAVVEEQVATAPEEGTPHSLERCVEQAFARFGRVAGERAEALRRASLEGWAVEDVAAYLGRTVRATHEFLSQSRKKFRPFLEECHEYLAA
jgi:RNA polymerase sigma-70 factor (ECF subfamily)